MTMTAEAFECPTTKPPASPPTRTGGAGATWPDPHLVRPHIGKGEGVSVPDRSHDTLLRLAHVKARTGLSRTTIYRRAAAGSFPRPTPISAGLVAWYETDVNAWVADPMGWRGVA